MNVVNGANTVYGKPPIEIESLKPPILMLPDAALITGTVKL